MAYRGRERSSRFKVHVGWTAAILLAAGFAGGCATTSNELQAAATFAKTASTLSSSVQTAYTQAAQDEANFQTSRYVVLSSRHNFDLTPIYNREYKSPRVPLGPKDIAGRYAAAAALAAYGQALTTLLDSKSQETDLSTATGKLTAALKSIPSATLARAHITSAEITNVGNLITAVGDLYLDFRRQQVLETVIPHSAPVVANLCALFGQDFDVHGFMFASIMLNNLDDVIESTDASIQANAEDLQGRAILLPIYQQTTAMKTQLTTSYSSLQDAAKSCVKTNAALADAVKNQTLTLSDVIDFATKTEAAYNAVMTTVAQK